MSQPLLTHVTLGELFQLRIHDRDQLIKSGLIALAPLDQQLCDLAGRRRPDSPRLASSQVFLSVRFF
jgi:hypothetical protein